MTLDDLQLADLAGKDFVILIALASAIACGLCIMFYAGCRAGLELLNEWRERRVKSAAYISAHVIQLPKANPAADGHDLSRRESNTDFANT
jgi:hypothetical protein